MGKILGSFIRDLSIVGTISLMSHAKLCDVLQPSEFLALCLLLFRFHQVFFDVFLHLFSHYLTVGLTLQNLSNTDSCVLSHTLDVVTEVLEPEVAELVEDRLRLIRECHNEVTECEAGAIANRPGLILEAIEKSFQHVTNVWLEWFLVNNECDFGAQL